MNKKSIFFLMLICALSLTGRAQVSPLLSNAGDYQLVFQDEFNGNVLDWNIWGSDDAVKTSASGETVGRWKENAVLADGLLKLMVKKGNRTDSEWTAGYVWVKQLFGPNTYYESRFRLTNATGVNNAFWTAVQTVADETTRSFKNRYEIDVVEAKRLNASNSITGHLAWHDWKTYSYSNSVDIAQGISKTYNTIDFQTWGLWVGEDNFIIYCNGVEQWRGTTHPTYTNQWKTGIGKLPTWPTQEEKRAYGKWGQSDWNYMGGMNGDEMNICLSTMPWSSSNSVLSDAANNSSMDIDFIRIYKRKSDLVTTPIQTVEAPVLNQSISLTKGFDLNVDKNYYFSFVANRPYNSNVTCALNSDNQTEVSFKISKDNELMILDAMSEVSTATAYPTSLTPEVYFETGHKFLIVGRITASISNKDIISFRNYELGKNIPEKEPFLYRNIDDVGNTSITNGWHINKKINSIKTIQNIEFIDQVNKCQISDFAVGDTYVSVVNRFLNKPVAYMYGETKSSTERRIYLNLKGKFPFKVTYTDGKTQVTQNKILDSVYTFIVNPVAVSQYSIVSATDADGNEAEVGGGANFYVTDADYLNIRPSFDTYLTEGSTLNPHTANDLFVSSKSGAAQESFLVFQLPQEQTVTEKANAVIYCTSKSITTPTKIELLGSTDIVNSATTWSTMPVSGRWESLDTKVLGATSGFYLDFDITPFCNTLFATNQRTFTLKIKQTIGDENAVTKFKPGHNTSSSVPSFVTVKKEIQSGIFAPQLATNPILCFHTASRQLSNCSEMLVSKVLLFNLAGQLLALSNTLPVIISDSHKGISIAHIITTKQTFVQKLIL